MPTIAAIEITAKAALKGNLSRGGHILWRPIPGRYEHRGKKKQCDWYHRQLPDPIEGG